jgi:hypothetical protein
LRFGLHAPETARLVGTFSFFHISRRPGEKPIRAGKTRHELRRRLAAIATPVQTGTLAKSRRSGEVAATVFFGTIVIHERENRKRD